MLRVIQELNPTWVIGENVPGIVNLALDTVLSDLENIGYSAQAFNIPACGVDAPHKRERIAILAYAVNRRGSMRWDRQFQDIKENGREGLDNGGRTAAAITGERRENESMASGMADGLRTGVHETVTDTMRFDVSRRGEESLLDAEFTKCSSRERERGKYRNNLNELLECTPLGLIGRTNPEWIEWLTGYPIGWTDLNA